MSRIVNVRPRVHDQSTEEVCPRDVVHAVLFACDCTSNNLSIQMVRKDSQQAMEHNTQSCDADTMVSSHTDV